MKKILFFSALFISFISQSKAQYDEDALRFSRMQHMGTARFNAMGGAFGALGGDFSSIYLNPAGVGVYRSSEFSMTPGFLFNSSESSFRGNQNMDSRFTFNMGNIGYVGHYGNGESGWKDYSFGIGYNRVSNFANRSYFSGISSADSEYLASSMVDDYVSDLNSAGITSKQIYENFPFGHYQAYYNYLLNPYDTLPTTNQYYREFQGEESIQQKSTKLERGGIGETFLSFGGNYNDKLYLGGSIGFQSLRYHSERRYEEEVLYDQTPDSSVLKGFTQNEELIVSGMGINFKLGMIYRISDQVRVGAAVHSPTFYSISEEYTMAIKSEFTGGEVYEVPRENQAVSNFDYRLQTPVRLMGSLAYVIADKALLSFDYEFANYKKIKLRDMVQFSYAYDFEFENQSISNNFAQTHNFRLGGEFRLDPFSLRAGLRYEDNPYESHVTADEKRLSYSLGAGFRNENFYMDMAYVLTKSDKLDYPYLSVEEPAYLENSANYITLTAGFKF